MRPNTSDYRQQLRHWLKTADGDGAAEMSRAAMLIVGCGTMGQQIAQLALRQGVTVGLFDVDPSKSRSVQEQLEVLPGAQPPHLHESIDEIANQGYGLALETILEQAAAKQRLLSELEPLIAQDAVLATNTSTLSLGNLSTGMKDPARLVGLHFLLPVLDRELIEIVRQASTPAQRLSEARTWCSRLGRCSLAVGDEIGFLVNRLLHPVLATAIELWLSGVSPRTIDRAALDWGIGFGPCLAMDHIGLDTVVRAGAGFWQRFPDRPRPSPLLPALVKRGRLGRKSLHGIYDYDQVQPANSSPQAQQQFLAELDLIDPVDPPDVVKIWESYRRERPIELVKEKIQARLWTALLDEAIQVCDEGYVEDPRAVDAAWIFGLGMTSLLNGPFYWSSHPTKLDDFHPTLETGNHRWKSRLAELALKAVHPD